MPVEEIDVEDVPGMAEQLELWTGGYRTVPTFDVDGQILVNPNRAELERRPRVTGAQARLVPAVIPAATRRR